MVDQKYSDDELRAQVDDMIKNNDLNAQSKAANAAIVDELSLKWLDGDYASIERRVAATEASGVDTMGFYRQIGTEYMRERDAYNAAGPHTMNFAEFYKCRSAVKQFGAWPLRHAIAHVLYIDRALGGAV